MTDESVWWRRLATPWRAVLHDDWFTVSLPTRCEPRWSGSCMKCGRRSGTGTLSRKAIAIDPNDPTQSVPSALRRVVPVCRICRVWRRAGVALACVLWIGLIYVASPLLRGRFPRGFRVATPWPGWEAFAKYVARVVLGMSGMLGFALLLWPLAWSAVAWALHVIDRGETVDYRFRTAELARDFAARNESFVQ